jgi:GNAT superfamily N-acetyltransferase
MIYKGYDIERISIADSVEELKLLHAAHYAETEVHYKSHQVGVNYTHYIESEAKGSVYCFGARLVDTGQLVAYLFMYLAPSAHDSSVVASADMFFLVREHRGSGIARRLLQIAQDCMKELGAHYMIVTDKSPLGAPHLKVLFESEGYSQIAIAYSKEL